MTNLITKIFDFEGTSKTGHVLLFLILLVFCAPGSNATGAIIDEPMTGPTAPGWIFGGTPNPAILTGDGLIDPVGDGWLRLTNTGNDQAGYAYLDTPFSITSGVVIQFDYTTWGGSGADGYSIFLFDAATSPFQIGASGGSLGYAQKTVSPVSPGLGGGYIGVGIDEFGNFSNPTEGRVGGPGQLPNSVAVRGPASTSWAYLGGSAANVGQLWFNQGTRPAQTGTDYRKVVIYLTPVAAPDFLQVDVYLQFGYNQPLTPVVLGLFTGQPVPANVKIGYAASTGGSTNNHEIRNLLVNPLNNDINLAIFKSASVATIDVGDPITYTLTARNYGPNPGITASNAPIIDNVPVEVTGVTWTCATTGTATCGAASGSGNNINTTATLPFNSSAIYTISGTLTSSPPSNQLANTADITVPPGVVDYNLRDNTDTVSVLVNSDLSTSTKTVVDINGGDIEIGDVLEYTITLDETAGGTASSVQVVDDIPANVSNFTLVSLPTGATDNSTGIGTGANNNGYLNISEVTVQGGTSETIVFEVTVNGTSGSTIDNTATISNPGGPAAEPSAPTLIIAGTSDLSTSTKTVVDLNGGEVESGDVLQYTIAMYETKGGAVSGVQVTDDIPANVNNFTVTSIPAGATDSSTFGGTGANGNGYLDVSNITIAANGSETIGFQVTVNGATGARIDNMATIINPAGAGATPNAQTLLIIGPASGLKPLYLYGATSYDLSRVPTMGTPAAIILAGGGDQQTWTLNPGLALPVTISTDVNATVPVTLYLAEEGFLSVRTVTVDLSCVATGTTLSLTQTLSLPDDSASGPAAMIFNLPFPNPAPDTVTCTDQWQLTVTNNETRVRRRVYVYPVDPGSGNISQVALPATTVINVDNASITFYDDSYTNSGNQITPVIAGSTVYIRATVSDPFGSFDINANPPVTLPDITIIDAAGTTTINASAMSEVAVLTTAASKTFEFAYTVPLLGPDGDWAIKVEATEGTEGNVSHIGINSMPVVSPMPLLTIMKSASSTSVTPGDTITYTVTVLNSGASGAYQVTLRDDLGNYTFWGVDSYGASQPFLLTQLAVDPDGGGPLPADSGVTLGTPIFYDSNSTVFTPVSAGGGAPAGYDSRVDRWELPMAGIMIINGQFRLQYQVMVE